MAAIVAGIATLAGPSTSQAEFKLRLTQGATVVELTDVDNDGVISFNGVVGSFTVNVSTGISKPVLGPATMDLNSINVGVGTLTIELTDTDFVGPAPGYNLDVGGTTNGTAAFLAGGTNSNDEYDISNPSPELVFNSSPYAGSAFLTSQGDDPYSLTIRAVITHQTFGGSSFDAELSPVPAPAGLILAATALPFVGLLRRRLRKPEAASAA